MAYIVCLDRNQTRMITTSLDELIDKDNSVRVIDAYVAHNSITPDHSTIAGFVQKIKVLFIILCGI